MTDQNKPGTTPEQSATDANDGGGDGNNNGNAPITQEYVDKLIGQARVAARETATKSLLTDLGVETVDQIKAMLKEKADLEAAKLTEQEKLQKQLDKYQSELERERKERERIAADLQRTRMQQAVIEAASAAELNLRPDAIKDIWPLIDQSKITVKDDGTFEGVEDAVKATVESRPYLLNTGAVATTARSVPAAVPPTPNGKTTPSQSAAHEADKQKRHRSAVRRLLG